MTFTVRANLRPWLGSAVLHALFALVLASAAVSWRSDPPAPQLAIEGNVVRYEDLPSSVRTGKPLREPVTVAPPVESRPRAEPEPVPQPRPEPPPESRPEASAKEQQAAAKAAATAERRQAERALEAKAQAETKAQNEAALAAEKRAEAAAKSKLETARKLAAAEAAAQQKQQEDAKAEAVRAARLAAAHEAELRRALADEEAGEAVARSGVMDEYRALLVQTIERNWIRPPSARAGLECTLYVTQAAGGTVIDVKIGACNGDEAVRDSVANAVYRSSPLPAPRDARAFERRLVIVFKPRE
jgi:colicin import membrane protein